jgi:hypothetical protein
MSTTKRKNGRFKVGNWVAFLYGTRNVFGQIVEARGPLGYKHSELYRIRVAGVTDEPDWFELSEDDFTAAAPPDKRAIIKYLKEGGLVTILRANLGGGPEKPSVWLTFKRRGEITHSFAAASGVVGGAAIPFFALQGARIYTPKQGEVIRFLESFGLTDAEAQEVITVVGREP